MTGLPGSVLAAAGIAWIVMGVLTTLVIFDRADPVTFRWIVPDLDCPDWLVGGWAIISVIGWPVWLAVMALHTLGTLLRKGHGE